MLKQVTLFDKIVILSTVFFILFFAFTFYRKAEYVTVTIKLAEDDISYNPWYEETGTRAWFAENIKPGIKEVDGLGRVIAEVLSVRSFDTKPGRKALYITTNLMTIYSNASNQHTFNGLPLVVGSKVRINFDRALVEGLVTKVGNGELDEERVEILVDARLSEENENLQVSEGIDPAIADEIKKIQSVKDSEGNTLIELINADIEDAKKLTVNSQGITVVQRNPLRKDVTLRLKVNVLKIGDRYYLFEDIPILVGERIPLNSQTLSIFPIVTGIQMTSTE